MKTKFTKLLGLFTTLGIIGVTTPMIITSCKDKGEDKDISISLESSTNSWILNSKSSLTITAKIDNADGTVSWVVGDNQPDGLASTINGNTITFTNNVNGNTNIAVGVTANFVKDNKTYTRSATLTVVPDSTGIYVELVSSTGSWTLNYNGDLTVTAVIHNDPNTVTVNWSETNLPSGITPVMNNNQITFHNGIKTIAGTALVMGLTASYISVVDGKTHANEHDVDIVPAAYQSIPISYFTTDGDAITGLNADLSGNTSYDTIYIPNTINGVEMHIVKSYAFTGTNSNKTPPTITDLIFDTNSTITTLGNWAFSYTNIVNAILPPSIEDLVESYDDMNVSSCFYNCSNLKQLTFLTSLKRYRAMNEATTSHYKRFTLAGTPFAGTGDKSDCNIWVFSSLLNGYKNDTDWKDQIGTTNIDSVFKAIP